MVSYNLDLRVFSKCYYKIHKLWPSIKTRSNHRYQIVCKKSERTTSTVLKLKFNKIESIIIGYFNTLTILNV